ncbi:class I SAM-dependent methyltransferase [Candidatus Aminicenantes bacterium AC-335-K20]|jgi:2-polyprenyl-3-methyl-5-hydroxy-6-metoxy-1,4-benzoquinol methylase|nr:class I SAM-dependent methyltransferase [SCandidatus Aminicenantes bacterium Aminicenantia_JdfR_composite]MCP2597020.1 class I SAM-dependent methyltransferase [Candidatus Aminicenantes bacterium AC-335-G13]MCP2619367.1 class I SAM-dependent methyltransferase [Candidatus Aminicenantes bacterium AC-335-K20]
MKKNIKICPLCGNREIKFFRKGNIKLENLSPNDIKITDSQYGKFWDLFACKNCNYIFSSALASANIIHSLYKEIKDPEYDEEAENRSLNFIRILSFIEKLKPEKGKLFDVGAATGILLNLAKKRGWKIDGIEPSKWAVNYALNKYGLRIKEGIFEEAELSENYYDVVTMIDLIEHIPDPVTGVKKAYKILKKNGILCIVTPDVRSFMAKFFGKRWWHFRPAHLSYFSRKSLTYLLKNSGFEIVKERKYVWTFSLYYLLSRFKIFTPLLKSHRISSLWKRIPLKLALGDSIEVYALKK